MKHKIAAIVTSLLTVFAATTVPFSAAASEKPADYTIADYTTAESFYNRVVLSKAWQQSDDRIERGEMLQLPQYMLNRMTTDALAEAVLDYPFFSDVYAFDNAQDGFDLMMEQFNGVQELADRDDVASVLLDKYCDEEVLTDASADEDVFRLTNMEILLSQNFVTTKLSKKEKSKYTKTVASKLADKAASPVYGEYTNNLMFELTAENTKDSALQKNMEKVRDGAYVKTPNGTRVSTTQSSSEPFTQSEINDMNRYADSQYPTATRYRSASGKYNCHSYAFYSTSTSNNHWMPNPSAYWNDGSYHETSMISGGRKLEFFSGNSPEHSAIVVSAYGAVTLESKWGPYGVYRHTTRNCPYTYCNILKYYCR